jgi:hypothetical protein
LVLLKTEISCSLSYRNLIYIMGEPSSSILLVSEVKAP